VLFTSIIGSILAFGSSQFISSFNNAFVVLVILSFVSLVALGAPSMDLNNLLYQNYPNVIKTIPIMLVALVYHNIVPSICAQLNYNKQSIRTAITAGSFIPLLMFLTWNAVILGIIGTSSDSSSSSQVGFDPVQVLRTGGAGGPTGALVSLFSEAAIITSFIGFVIGLMDFYADVFRGKSRRDLSLYSLVLLPPLGIAIASPHIFAGALDYAGTFGISILFGAIPAMMAYKLRSTSTSTSSSVVNTPPIPNTYGAKNVSFF
jgi:tyrosine-specific transport protein